MDAAGQKELCGDCKPSECVRFEAPPSNQELGRLCRTLRTTNFLTDLFISVQLDSSRADAIASHDLSPEHVSRATAPPSRTERLRILRAFYRRQLLASSEERGRPGLPSSTNMIAVGEGQVHFGEFKLWELQQIDDANHFIQQMCLGLVLARQEDIARQGAESTLEPITPEDFGALYWDVAGLVRHLKEAPKSTARAVKYMPSSTNENDAYGGIPEDLYRDYARPHELTFCAYGAQVFRWAI